eukprot:203514-Prymnesium_polylepis.1
MGGGGRGGASGCRTWWLEVSVGTRGQWSRLNARTRRLSMGRGDLRRARGGLCGQAGIILVVWHVTKGQGGGTHGA